MRFARYWQLKNWLRLEKPAPATYPAFAPMDNPHLAPRQEWLEEKLKKVLKQLGMSGHYTCHSLRRGGATLSMQAGVPGEYIRLQGDWKSDAYLDYAWIPAEERERCAHIVANFVKLSYPPTPLRNRRNSAGLGQECGRIGGALADQQGHL